MRPRAAAGEAAEATDEWEVLARTLDRAVRDGRMTEAERRRVAEQLFGAQGGQVPEDRVRGAELHLAPVPEELVGARPSARQRRRVERQLRRAVFAGQLDEGQYLRRSRLASEAASQRQLADLVCDLPTPRRPAVHSLLPLLGALLLALTVVMLAVDFAVLALGHSPGTALVVPTAAIWGLSVLVALCWLPFGRRRPGSSPG